LFIFRAKIVIFRANFFRSPSEMPSRTPMYNGVILHAHPVRGESHNQRNATGEVATVAEI